MSYMRREPGRRILKEGMRGADVIWLQEKLIEWGYALNGVDGLFGPLTFGAVLELQRDFKLRADGIAGPMVFSLLQDPPPIIRHTIEGRETLLSIARQWGVGTVGLREANRWLTPAGLYVGRRLIIPCRYVVVFTDPSDPRVANSIVDNNTNITGLLLQVELGRSIDRDLLSFCLEHELSVFLDVTIDETVGVMARRRKRKQIIDEVCRLCHRTTAKAVHIDLSGNTQLLSLGFLHRLKDALHQKKRKLVLTYPYSPRESFPPYLTIADRVILSSVYKEKPSICLPSFAHLRQGIIRLGKLIPSWRIWLKLPLCAWEYDDETASGRTISHGEGMEFLRRSRTKPVWSEELKVIELSRGLQRVWLPNETTMMHWLWLVNRYNLGGIVLTGVGLEDKRLWRCLKQHFLIHK
jgi:hypothetical protein